MPREWLGMCPVPAGRIAHRTDACTGGISPEVHREFQSRRNVPSSSTKILSAASTVDSLWAITIVVGLDSPSRMVARASRIERSVNGVQGRRWLVHYQDPGLLEYCPGDCQPLPLSAGEPVAHLADNSLVAVGQTLYQENGVAHLDTPTPTPRPSHRVWRSGGCS